MNAATKTFVIAIAAVTTSAAIGVGLANRTAAPATEIVKLDRVVVVGKRANAQEIAKLPRVVIEARRTASTEVAMASAKAVVDAT
jgi:hypothetical protein